MIRNLFFFVVGIVCADLIRSWLGYGLTDKYGGRVFTFVKGNLKEGLAKMFPEYNQDEIEQLAESLQQQQPRREWTEDEIEKGYAVSHVAYTDTQIQVAHVGITPRNRN